MAEEQEVQTETEAPLNETEETAKPNGAADDWRESIDDEKLREHAQRFDSVKSLVNGHMELRKQLSGAVVPPGKDATEEQVAAYRKALGVPESVEGYEFTVPEDHELTDEEKEFQTAAATKFHELNIPASAAKDLTEWFGEMAAQTVQAQIEADKAYAEESEAQLRKEWPGQEFEKNRKIADKAGAEIFGTDYEDVRHIETKDGRFVLDHPAFVRMLARYGREMQEGTLGGVMTEEQIESMDNEIDKLQGEIEKAQMSGDGDKANRLYLKQQELYRKKVGSAPVVGSEGRTV